MGMEIIGCVSRPIEHLFLVVVIEGLGTLSYDILARKGGWEVLVLEPNPATRSALQRDLRTLGARVRAAGSLESAPDGRWDMVMVDESVATRRQDLVGRLGPNGRLCLLHLGGRDRGAGPEWAGPMLSKPIRRAPLLGCFRQRRSEPAPPAPEPTPGTRGLRILLLRRGPKRKLQPR